MDTHINFTLRRPQCHCRVTATFLFFVQILDHINKIITLTI